MGLFGRRRGAGDNGSADSSRTAALGAIRVEGADDTDEGFPV